ncbi:MAG: 50S ribosomal protein L18 [Candidatus Zambryskibacteria bacterium CG10_big_fil_rev_8_21_14_0_10_42_12]|uniref:Large ribosomal subunit protein uL18 n=1 Tax=Candidatus Zambryskibacteria bacterium CG10_big_fil_rev_8_21_14_0_10_42_12 TaxID=1975115 RepID=A0A2H0QX62_9BACT|nr:MAG: 50S ribosomal protein L18 [Candidatus Zambryskibacteria bacterium CG10_big_fil_rev_8_21_14_0_10_42_12]
MNNAKQKTLKRQRRHKRIRAKIQGTVDAPRISVFRSNKHVFVQAIDDVAGKTLASAWTKNWKDKALQDASFEAGKDVAGKLMKAGITKGVFDRGGFIYTGNITKVAEGLREGGLKI